MTTQQLNYFLSVATHLSFTDAARDFYMTQPAITHQISALESELNTKLFHRSTRNVTLTRSGELFLEDAKRILSLEESSKERIRLADATKDLNLNISYLLSPCKIFLPELIHRFHDQYPQVKITLKRLDAQGILESIAHEDSDIYISMGQDLKHKKNYSYKALFVDSYCLICRDDHPCLNGSNIDYSKIATEPFFMLESEKAPLMEKQILQVCRELHINPRVTQYFESMEDIVFAVECGLGISILPYKIKDYMSASLAYVPLPLQMQHCTMAISWKPEIDNPAISWMLELLNEMQKTDPQLF